MSIKPSIVWFRQDLRLDDQPALQAAIAKGGPVILLYCWAPQEEGEWALGSASRWWLHGSLASLQEELRRIGAELIIRKQPSLEALVDVVKKTGADAVYWNRRYEPYALQNDAFIKEKLHQQGIKSYLFNASLLYDPSCILTKQNKPYQVFTPFWKACMHHGEPESPLPAPKTIISFPETLSSDPLHSLGLLPTIPWDAGLRDLWVPGTAGARKRLSYALEKVVQNYVEQRDYPSVDGTSQLSSHLHFGEISPRRVWQIVRWKFGQNPAVEGFLRQLIWREFAYHLLFHFPRTPTEGLRQQFHYFPWKKDEKALRAWQKGLTGYPIVDAGMRQLWRTGWMHNRVRMIVGSFLVKDLLINWREGARWFWETLVDADLANNTLGWQWVGGCGADAAPYFRIFNPVLQGEKFDQSGEYVRKWIPEIAALPNQWIHKPWETPEDILRGAQVKLGETYPQPIVDHGEARKIALQAYQQVKEK